MKRQLTTHPSGGFTIIELLVVLATLALLIAIVAPRYGRHVDQAREVALRESLVRVRETIDQFVADQGRYPDSLAELVDRRYLRAVPVDPVTGRADTWAIVAPPVSTAQNATTLPGKVYDLHSGAPGSASDGSTFASW